MLVLKHVVVANGWTYADALVGGYFAAKNNGPILLSSNNKIINESLDFISKNRAKIFILGGEKMISSDLKNYIDHSLNLPIELIHFSIDGMQMAHTKNIIKAEAKNQEGLLFRFQFKEAKSYKWHLIKEYSKENTASWVPIAEGSYDYKVDIKYEGSPNDSDFSKENRIEVVALTPAKITKFEIEGNGYRNTNHTIIAEATSINSILYKLILKNEITGEIRTL